ncbi:MAG TPA: phytase [Caulobacteraceae bacterium]|nr:phytase [Caulobacteraceae bacterium]
MAACALVDPEYYSDSDRMTVGVGTPVPAAGETVSVATSAADAADDPEIWADPADPSRAVIFGTDKKAGLYVYGLDGAVRQFLPEGPLNNVDLRPGFTVGGREQVLVGASDRARKGVAFFLLDPATLQVSNLGFTPVALPDPYGFCMGVREGSHVVVMTGESGEVRQLRVGLADGRPMLTEERRFAVGSQAEGCVVDERTGALYVGEEAKGVWRYGFDPASGAMRTLVAAAPSQTLEPDVEGLALLREGEKTWLIASSQGDSAFSIWRVDGPSPAYAGRFSVVAANGVDAVTGTDGVAALGGPVGSFGQGLVVVQDDVDSEGETASTTRERQNFKLVDWAAVRAALSLP